MRYLLDQILAILAPRHMEYLVLDENFNIMEMSKGVRQFAAFPSEVILGRDIRLGFPEFIGLENSLMAIQQGQQSCFELTGLGRCSDNEHPSLYIDIHAFLGQDKEIFENQLVLLLEDVTEKMIMQQQLAQAANEANLLLSALANSKSYIDKIIASMADALLVTSMSGKIKTINQASQDLFGYSEQELINQPISSILTKGNFLDNLMQNYWHQKCEILEDIEVICYKKTGEQIIVSFSCSAIQTDRGEPLDIIYIGRDITVAKHAEVELQRALDREKELNEFKSRFFSMVSHEFGNPLITVLMSVELLKKYGSRKTEGEKLKYLEHIQIAAKQMSNLLKDILVIGQAEVGKLEFIPAPLDLIQFCCDVVEEIKLGASSGTTITFTHTDLRTGEDQQGRMLLLDEKLLRHILSNLLSNAVKYSPQGGTIQFDLLCQHQEVIFSIKDQGIGIPLEAQQRLFESFYRAKNVGTIPGTGLGLAIVKQSVDLHGGKIKVTSDIGLGTTFTVTLPLIGKKETALF